MLDPARLEQLADEFDGLHHDDHDLTNLAPQLARDHAALLRWASEAAEAIKSIDHSRDPCEGDCIVARRDLFAQINGAALLAALDDLRTT